MRRIGGGTGPAGQGTGNGTGQGTGDKPPARRRLPAASGAGVTAPVAAASHGSVLRGLDKRSFAAPGTREGRIGVIDAGSNSVRLVVFEGGSRSPSVVHNEKVMCGLGRGLAQTGLLNPEGATRAMAAMRRFAAVADHLNVATLAGVATAAIRDADDGPAFRDAVEVETGIRLKVASGEDEARLAVKGVLFGDPRADGVVADLGGASLELGRVDRGRIGAGVTTPLGPLRLDEAGDPDAVIDAELRRLPAAIRRGAHCIYLVGGAWRAFARVDMETRDWPLKVLHEYRMNGADALTLAKRMRRMAPAELAAIDGVSESRAAGLPMTARLMRGLVETLSPETIIVSAYGLREGICLEAMPDHLATADPLLSAATAIEAVHARTPGFGRELGTWVTAALPPQNAEEARLIRASALLADISWRAHPDHRVLAAWEISTRATLTGIGHEGRMFIALALAARYRRNRKAVMTNDAMSLVSEAQAARAGAIGLALRLGCSVAASAKGVLPHSRLTRDGGDLRLVLAPNVAEMAGEDLEKRLSQLAKAMGLTSGGVVIGPPRKPDLGRP
ncbi:MAG: Ppx/GppA phosphatase family protein [Pseudomonadota bacterium]